MCNITFTEQVVPLDLTQTRKHKQQTKQTLFIEVLTSRFTVRHIRLFSDVLAIKTAKNAPINMVISVCLSIYSHITRETLYKFVCNLILRTYTEIYRHVTILIKINSGQFFFLRSIWSLTLKILIAAKKSQRKCFGKRHRHKCYDKHTFPLSLEIFRGN
jgi:hypothetical protein